MSDKEKGLVIYKENVLSRILVFFKLIFVKKEKIAVNELIDEETIENVNNNYEKKNESLSKSIKVNKDIKGESLFEDYRNGEISESEMTLDQIILLKKIYNKKIQHAKIELAYMDKKIEKKLK